jgi:hypothetical protein
MVRIRFLWSEHFFSVFSRQSPCHELRLPHARRRFPAALRPPEAAAVGHEPAADGPAQRLPSSGPAHEQSRVRRGSSQAHDGPAADGRVSFAGRAEPGWCQDVD